MTDHTARPESWDTMKQWAARNVPDSDCILELRARVERLEQAQQQPEPEPADNQTLHSVALRMVDTLANLGVLAEITDTIRRAIREPMAKPAEPIDRMDVTLGELLRLNELWNAGESGGCQLNLSGLDLRGADLSDTDLRDADLSGAYMRNANLTRANLRRANLHGASTRGAIGLPKPAPVEPASPPEPFSVDERLPMAQECNEEGEVWVEEVGSSYAIADTGDYGWDPHRYVLRALSAWDISWLRCNSKLDDRDYPPTHWMPLPAPPQEQADE